ncbi:hypothetical protein [Candidatus Protochlamydia phocaeensis]|uniref:hypothetical protein n=1 Tax=Candidatus Protochlamydia phocaeensis TaxID=1414722 RepID=UPI0012AB42D2|nr:hypothetical protein [Candidatus Protochlamydia phocaeensis]
MSERAREIIIEGSGPLASVVYATGLSALGFYSGDLNTCLSLNGLAIGHLSNLLGYAALAMIGNNYTENGQTNDFAQLRKLGIHPIFPIMGISLVAVKIFKDALEYGLGR